jgi:hypothetical protein
MVITVHLNFVPFGTLHALYDLLRLIALFHYTLLNMHVSVSMSMSVSLYVVVVIVIQVSDRHITITNSSQSDY